MALATGFAARDGRASHGRSALGLLAAALTLSGLAVVLLARIAWGDVAAHLEARDWPTAEAHVRAVSLDRRSSPAASGAEQYLALSAVYVYEVDGVAYEGHRASLRDTADLHDRGLQALYGRLHFSRLTGRAVTVAYDPADPQRALVDTSLDLQPVALRIGLAISLLAAALICAGTVARALRDSA